MDRVICGDNQFFGINHLSDEKSRAQEVRFKNDVDIIKVIDDAIDVGIKTFMCTTHDRMRNICAHITENQQEYKDFPRDRNPKWKTVKYECKIKDGFQA